MTQPEDTGGVGSATDFWVQKPQWLFIYIYIFSNQTTASQVVLVVKNAGDTRDTGSIVGLGRPHGGRHGNPLQYSCLENPHGQRSLARYSPWGHRESDTTAGRAQTTATFIIYLALMVLVGI